MFFYPLFILWTNQKVPGPDLVYKRRLNSPLPSLLNSLRSKQVYSKMKKYVVDVQGFKASLNEFVFKEVAILRLEEDATPSIFLFKPPYSWTQLLQKNKSENRHLERNFHGLSWRSGEIPYEELSSALHAILDDAEIYVKGLEKVEWLRRFFPHE